MKTTKEQHNGNPYVITEVKKCNKRNKLQRKYRKKTENDQNCQSQFFQVQTQGILGWSAINKILNRKWPNNIFHSSEGADHQSASDVTSQHLLNIGKVLCSKITPVSAIYFSYMSSKNGNRLFFSLMMEEKAVRIISLLAKVRQDMTTSLWSLLSVPLV